MRECRKLIHPSVPPSIQPSSIPDSDLCGRTGLGLNVCRTLAHTHALVDVPHSPICVCEFPPTKPCCYIILMRSCVLTGMTLILVCCAAVHFERHQMRESCVPGVQAERRPSAVDRIAEWRRGSNVHPATTVKLGNTSGQDVTHET